MSTRLLVLGICLTLVSGVAYASPVQWWVTGGQTTPLPTTTTTVNFDDPIPANFTYSATCPFAGCAGSMAYPVVGSSPSQFKAPTGDGTKYISTPEVPGSNPYIYGGYTITLNGSVNYFGLYWGSVDTYNTITFYNGTNQVFQLSGADIAAKYLVNGDASYYVNFKIDGGYDKIVLSSTQAAFESDNHAIGNTPEPASMLLFGTGLLGAGVVRRLRKKA